MNNLVLGILGIFGLTGWELVIIAFIILLLFGAKRIPDLMRGLGKGIRGFKDGMEDVKAEINRPVDAGDSAKKTEGQGEEKDNAPAK